MCYGAFDAAHDCYYEIENWILPTVLGGAGFIAFDICLIALVVWCCRWRHRRRANHNLVVFKEVTDAAPARILA